MSKTLDRIGLLLNQAENTDNADEAAAFMEKAQKLATLAAVDLEVARRRQADKTKRELPEQRTITVAQRSASGYNSRGDYTRGRVENNAAEYVWLFSAIASPNDVVINIAHNSTYVIAFGFPSDIDVCEALFSSLKVQMVAAANAEIAKGEYKKEMVWSDSAWKTKPLDARVFRTRFYEAFTSEIGRRLRTARKEALAAAETTFDLDVTDEQGEVSSESQTGALVLVEKAVEVSDYYKRTSKARGSYRGGSGRSTAHSNTASTAGKQAGQRARIGTQAGITSGRAQIA